MTCRRKELLCSELFQERQNLIQGTSVNRIQGLLSQGWGIPRKTERESMKAILTECLLSARHWGYRNDTEVALVLSLLYYIFSGPVCLELGAREE